MGGFNIDTEIRIILKLLTLDCHPPRYPSPQLIDVRAVLSLFHHGRRESRPVQVRHFHVDQIRLLNVISRSSSHNGIGSSLGFMNRTLPSASSAGKEGSNTSPGVVQREK